MPTLSDITNATGYVTFQNATAGSYTFKIIKEGYPPMNETIPYTNTAQPLALTITLSNSNTNSKNSSNTLIIIVSVVVTAVVVAVISSMSIVRRKKSPNTKKLQDLQKQMKSKFES